LPAGRPTKLTPELIDRAAEVAAECPSYTAIANVCGVSRQVVALWIERGKTDQGTELEKQFSGAILEQITASEKRLAIKLATGEPKDAAWLLTHSPFFRDEWSDASAARREVQKAMANVAQAIEASSLSPEQRLELFTRLGATGLEPPSVDA
jgi:transposase